MTHSLFSGSSYEASRRTAFAGNALRRETEDRTSDCLEEAIRHEHAHAYVFIEGRALFKHDRSVLDPLFAPYELKMLRPATGDGVLLGHKNNGEPRLAFRSQLDIHALPDHVKAIDLRTVYVQGLVPPAELGEIAQAGSLVSWNAESRFCGHCGAETESEAGGYRRRCPACERLHFPRTDPVVIMLAVDEKQDRCLLGRSPHFAPGMYSCLAGFVEPGETIEDAVRRETEEESGIRIGRVAYHASQPWPFPHSLMIGCYGEALSEAIDLYREELEDCRWFTRAEVTEMLGRTPGEKRTTPPRGAIAHRLIEDWLTTV